MTMDVDLSGFVRQTDDGARGIDFAIDGMTCAACIVEIEQAMKKIPGVERARVNYSNSRLALGWKEEGLDPAKAVAATAFRYVAEGDAASFYWVERDFGYAVTGRLARERIQAIAPACSDDQINLLFSEDACYVLADSARCACDESNFFSFRHTASNCACRKAQALNRSASPQAGGRTLQFPFAIVSPFWLVHRIFMSTAFILAIFSVTSTVQVMVSPGKTGLRYF